MSEVRYGISCELGEIETKAYRLKGTNGSVYDSGREFYEATAPLERFKSNRFKELALEFSTNTSTRRAAAQLNRVRNESDGIGATTYRNMIEGEGQNIQAKMEEKADKQLKENGFIDNGRDIEWNKIKPAETKYIDEKIVEEAARALNISKYDASEYESAETSVNISIDEVGVNRQVDTRPPNDKNSQRKRVENTVIQVENEDGRYILNGNTIMSTIKLLIGFLLNNGLIDQEMVIFADGARNINGAVQEMLGFAKYKIIMDWYHLDKKCREVLSMGLKGVKIRDELLGELLPSLWFGNVDGAISVLHGIEPEKVKEPTKVAELAEYFERIRNHVPCYALRKRLGLRNSSNRGEKANDLIVSSRQKHNGMSWSDDGSFAFASVSAASFNGEIGNWLRDRDISFKLQPRSA
jgi:hypothetical protein